jgi:hypothetical protein
VPGLRVFTGRVKDRPLVRLKDLPASGQTVELWWRKRRLVCVQSLCPRKTFTQEAMAVGLRASARRSADGTVAHAQQDDDVLRWVGARERAVRNPLLPQGPRALPKPQRSRRQRPRGSLGLTRRGLATALRASLPPTQTRHRGPSTRTLPPSWRTTQTPTPALLRPGRKPMVRRSLRRPASHQDPSERPTSRGSRASPGPTASPHSASAPTSESLSRSSLGSASFTVRTSWTWRLPIRSAQQASEATRATSSGSSITTSRSNYGWTSRSANTCHAEDELAQPARPLSR